MRVASVSEIKSEHWGGTRDYPRPGSRTRLIYDTLRKESGRTVDLNPVRRSWPVSALSTAIRYLMDDYGCDIRRGKRGCEYILAGEWFGAHYSDYANQAIDEAVRGAQ